MGKLIVKGALKKIFLIIIIGAFVSVQQTSAESIFQEEERFSLHHLVLTTPVLHEGSNTAFLSFGSDTIETYEIELEEEEGPGLYKEIAMFVIIAAVVGYMVVQLIQPDEEEETDTGKGGKDVASPPSGFSINVSW
jgi:hypothetical protein